MPAVLVTLTILLRRTPASFINFLHYCSPSSGFYGAREDNRGICTDNPSGRHPIRTMGALTSSVIPPLPLLPQPSQFTPAWDRHRIMLACMPSGLVTQWLGHPQRKWICEAHAETTCRLVNILNVSRKGDSSDAALPNSTVATWLYFSKDKTSPS